MNIKWRKSTRSEDHGNCVEVAALPSTIAIRDSKAPHAGHLTLTPRAFARLLAHVRNAGGSH